MMHVFLKTSRLLLRPFTPDDVELLFDLDSDPQVMRYLTGGAPTPRAAIQNEILPAFLHSYDQGEGFGVWAAIGRTSGDFLGWFSLRPSKDADVDTAELGYRLRRAVWGYGFATEGARALLRKGFSDLGVQRVMATTYQDNHASRRVMEKLGMRLVRTFRLTLDDLRATHTFQSASEDVWDGDDGEYAIAKAEWEQQKLSSRQCGAQFGGFSIRHSIVEPQPKSGFGAGSEFQLAWRAAHRQQLNMEVIAIIG
jgi:RimJ/RimL family protein N-acetyltransferase